MISLIPEQPSYLISTFTSPFRCIEFLRGRCIGQFMNRLCRRFRLLIRAGICRQFSSIGVRRQLKDATNASSSLLSIEFVVETSVPII